MPAATSLPSAWRASAVARATVVPGKPVSTTPWLPKLRSRIPAASKRASMKACAVPPSLECPAATARPLGSSTRSVATEPSRARTSAVPSLVPGRVGRALRARAHERHGGVAAALRRHAGREHAPVGQRDGGVGVGVRGADRAQPRRARAAAVADRHAAEAEVLDGRGLARAADGDDPPVGQQRAARGVGVGRGGRHDQRAVAVEHRVRHAVLVEAREREAVAPVGLGLPDRDHAVAPARHEVGDGVEARAHAHQHAAARAEPRVQAPVGQVARERERARVQRVHARHAAGDDAAVGEQEHVVGLRAARPRSRS